MSSGVSIELGVSDFVAVANQTLEYAYPSVAIIGELANFKISKNRWVYFDLKDEFASLRFFGTVYQLKVPLEDGMMLRVVGTPRLHPQFGFSVTVTQISLVGEGSIKRAATLLEKKLTAEGLFDPARKRTLPYPPQKIGLVASGESAAYSDFIKILCTRWAGIEIVHADVQVQGVDAPDQLVVALASFNMQPNPVDVVVVTRGGGSAEDLQAFNTESVVRAIAGSRIPTLVAIGHERDISLAELAADVRASTPSNAAEILTPDKAEVIAGLKRYCSGMAHALVVLHSRQVESLQRNKVAIEQSVMQLVSVARERLKAKEAILNAYNPLGALERGYALVRLNHRLVHSAVDLSSGDLINIELKDASIEAIINNVNRKSSKKKGK